MTPRDGSLAARLGVRPGLGGHEARVVLLVLESSLHFLAARLGLDALLLRPERRLGARRAHLARGQVDSLVADGLRARPASAEKYCDRDERAPEGTACGR